MKFIVTIIAVCAIWDSPAQADMAVRISRPISTTPGGTVSVEIALDNADPAAELAGFDFYLTFDSALMFQSVVMGRLPTACRWEYFTYRLDGPGRLHLLALADLNNGAVHPLCYCDSSGILTVLTFTITETPAFEYDFLRIGWMWYDCGDNAFSSLTGDTLYISREVYDFDGETETVITRDTAFPTPYGAPDQCLPGARAVDFFNGGVHLITADTVPPTALCPTGRTVGTDFDLCGAIVSFAADVWDNYPGAVISCNPPSGWFFSRGTTAVTCIAMDLFDNTDTCSFDIRVIDDQPPSPICPGHRTIASQSGECAASVSYSAGVTDNCPGAAVFCDPPSGSSFPVGSAGVTCAAVDVSGNIATCDFTVTVIDGEPPILELPADVTVPGVPDQCGTAVLYEVAAADNCPGMTVTCLPESGSFFPLGTDSVRCTAVDANGNTVSGGFTVTVIDTQPPEMQYPVGQDAAADPGRCGADVSYEVLATDDCTGAGFFCTPSSGSYFPVGVSTVTCVATDGSGNADTIEFSVTVHDTHPPVILAPDDIIAANDPGRCGAILVYEALAVDNCPGASLRCRPPSGDFFPVGFGAIECVATDSSGNTDTATIDVIVADTVRPSLICPDPIHVLNDSGFYGAIVHYDPIAGDNCPGVALRVTPPSGSFFEAGTSEVRVIATDAVGNATACVFPVTIELNDPDGDGRPTWDDNCPDDYNPDQFDGDGDGIGDTCDWRHGDPNRDNQITIADAVFLIGYIFKGGPAPDPMPSGDADCDGGTDISDAVFLINYIFSGGPEPSCL